MTAFKCCNLKILFNMKQLKAVVLMVLILITVGADALYDINGITIPLTYSSLYRPGKEWIQPDESYSGDDIMNLEFVTQQEFNAERDVVFRLYTTSSLKNPEVIRINNLTSLVESFWNPNYPTRILIHGMLADSEAPINVLLREAYLTVGEFNVVTVDWSKGAYWNGENDDENLMRNAQLVSVFLARFIDWLNINGNLKFYHIYILGHSIGAHIAGIAGKHVTRGKINTIVGLDPALGPYKNVTLDKRLTHTDAEYVEIIHTNGGGLGFAQPIGTADFYPNGGSFQPGCGSEPFSICSHMFSLTFMAESINPINKRFTAIHCRSYDELNCVPTGARMVNMGGEPSNHNVARGIYYLTTNSVSPFARGSISPF